MEAVVGAGRAARAAGVGVGRAARVELRPLPHAPPMMRGAGSFAPVLHGKKVHNGNRSRSDSIGGVHGSSATTLPSSARDVAS